MNAYALRKAIALGLMLAGAPALAQTGLVVAQLGGPKAPGLPVSPKTCEPAPAAVKDIATETVYTDPKRSVVNAVVVDRNNRATAALDRPLKDIIGWSSLYLAKKDQAAAACALDWMASWAKGGAMLGAIKGEQAEADRKWRTAGLAVAYLKLKERASPEQAAAIEGWLATLADRVIEAETKANRVNNRRYWAGLTATAVGFAAGNDKHKAYGRDAFAQLASNIGADGSLTTELQRGQLSAHLHNYALAPLILSAEIAARNGENWYGDAGSAIHKAAAFVASVNADPSVITKLTGAHQKQPSSGVLGWQAFYQKRFPGKIKPVKGAPTVWEYSWLGGDLNGMAGAWVR